MSVGLSDRLCAFIADTRPQDLSAATLAAAKRVLLDASGVMLGASGMAEEVRPFIALAKASGTGPCAILGTGQRTSAPMAAFANGAMAHALDFEDSFDPATGHPNASLVPALLALAQAEGPIDGPRFLTALAVGCELSCRMALALRRPMEAGGWYPPPILAGFGAVAGAANLLGLNAVQARDALSLMLTQTMPGEIKYSQRTSVRAVREAFPAQAAVQAVLLARAGVAGFEEPLEGRSGFYALYANGEYDPADLTDALGRRFWIEQLTFKPWPSCRGTHPFIEMAIDLQREHSFGAGNIAAIRVDIDDVQKMLIEPLARKQAPDVVIDAKFSIPFCIGLAFHDGMVTLDSFVPARLRDPAVLALAAKVEPRYVADTPWQRGSGGAMAVTLNDGRSFAGQVDNARGCPARPLDDAAMVAKFADCAGRAVLPPNPMQLADSIFALESCADVGVLFG